jgi:Zn-dependent protease with chaperone function
VSTQPPARRLNPFIFPTNTDLQFVLLIALIFTVGAAAYYLMILLLPGFSEIYFDTLRTCIATHQVTVSTLGQSVLDSFALLLRGEIDAATSEVARSAVNKQAYEACLRPAQTGLVVRILTGLGALFGGGALLYGLMPFWIDRRNKVQQLTRDDAPEALDALAAMAHEMGLRAPRWVWTPLDLRSAAQAYGGWGDKTVWLSGGLIAQHYTDVKRFRAVALHELAHIKNGDAGKTYFATMLFVAYLVFTLAPQLLTLILFTGGRSAASWLAELWQVLALGVIVLAVRNTILRERECYADVRASALHGTREGLQAALAGEAQGEQRALLRPFATHPPTRQRVAALASPVQLFQPSATALFISGLLFGLVSQKASLPLGAAPDTSDTMVLIFAPLFAALAIGTVALSHWRAMFAHQMGAAPAPALRGSLLRFVGGFLLAQIVLTPASLFEEAEDVLGPVLIVLSHLVWAGWLAMVLALTTAWASALAQIWLPGDDAARPSGLRTALWLVTTWAVTALLIQSVMLAYGGAMQSPMLGSVYAFLLPLLVVSTSANAFGWLLLWIVPLLAHVARGRRTGTPAWAFLDAPGPDDAGGAAVQPLGQPVLQPRRASLSGLLAGVLAMVLLGVGRYLYTTIDVDTPSGAAQVQLLGALVVAGQMMLMIVAGAATAGRVRYFRITQGLLAASIVALCVGVLTFLTRVWRPLAETTALAEAVIQTKLLLSFGMPLAVVACWVIARLRR